MAQAREAPAPFLALWTALVLLFLFPPLIVFDLVQNDGRDGVLSFIRKFPGFGYRSFQKDRHDSPN